MITFIDPNSNQKVSSWNKLSRKAYFIHGTTSDNSRWKDFALTVQQLNRVIFGIGTDKKDKEDIDEIGSSQFKKIYCDFTFEWGNNGWFSPGNNWFLNNVEDRRKASEKLIQHIKGNIGLCDEVVLIGHSHGGNVAIQAADAIFNKIPQIKHVFVLTIGTPAYNRKYIVSYFNNPNLTTINEGIIENCGYLGKEYIVPVMKLHRISTKSPISLCCYINCENPINWEHKSQISHTALWNKQDKVDDLAWVLDKKMSPYESMTLTNSAYFDSPTTNNVEFDFDPQKSKKNYEKKIEPINEWLSKLDYLRHALIELRFQQYVIPAMPALLTYNEYASQKADKKASIENDYNIPKAERDAIPDLRPKYIPKINMNKLSSKIGNQDYNLITLFKSPDGFYDFLRNIDNTTKDYNQKSFKDIIDIYAANPPELKAIMNIKQEMCNTTNYMEIYNYIYLIDNTSFQEHGFDLSNVEGIRDKIDNGDIKPFPKAHAQQVSKPTRE